MSTGAPAGRPLRFVLVGAVNTAVSYGCYVALLDAGLGLPLAGLLSLLAGLLSGFVLQGRFVFGHLSVGAFARFTVVWALLYGVHLGVVTGLLRLGVDPRLGALVALVVLTLLSYGLQRGVVFVPPQTTRR